MSPQHSHHTVSCQKRYCIFIKILNCIDVRRCIFLAYTAMYHFPCFGRSGVAVRWQVVLVNDITRANDACAQLQRFNSSESPYRNGGKKEAGKMMRKEKKTKENDTF